MYTLYQSGAGCILGAKAVMGEILDIGPVMGCIPCVREVRCQWRIQGGGVQGGPDPPPHL